MISSLPEESLSGRIERGFGSPDSGWMFDSPDCRHIDMGLSNENSVRFLGDSLASGQCMGIGLGYLQIAGITKGNRNGYIEKGPGH